MKSSKTERAKAKPQNIHGIRTINDLMMSVEGEIASLKDGTLTEAKARVIAKNRDIQLKAFEVILSAAKLEAKLRPELGRRVGLAAIAGPEDPKQPPVQ